MIDHPEARTMIAYAPLMDRLVAAEKKTRPEHQPPAKWAWSVSRDGQVEIQMFKGSFGYAGFGPTVREAFLNLCENFATVLQHDPETLDQPETQDRLKRRAAFLEVVAEVYEAAGGEWWKP